MLCIAKPIGHPRDVFSGSSSAPKLIRPLAKTQRHATGLADKMRVQFMQPLLGATPNSDESRMPVHLLKQKRLEFAAFSKFVGIL